MKQRTHPLQPRPRPDCFSLAGEPSLVRHACRVTPKRDPTRHNVPMPLVHIQLGYVCRIQSKHAPSIQLPIHPTGGHPMHRPVDPDDDTGLPLQRSVRVIRRSSEMAMGAALIRVVPVPRPGDETDNTPSLFLVNLDVTRRSPLAIATSVRIEPDAGESTLRVTPHRHMFDVAWMRSWRTSEAHSASERVGASDERRATCDERAHVGRVQHPPKRSKK